MIYKLYINYDIEHADHLLTTLPLTSQSTCQQIKEIKI